jgi:hypothetical protein
MVGLPKSNETHGQMNLKEEVSKVFAKDDCIDPFVYTRYEINHNSKDFQDIILTREILALEGW